MEFRSDLNPDERELMSAFELDDLATKQKLLETLANKYFDGESAERIKSAMSYVQQLHASQVRSDGRTFAEHLFSVVYRLLTQFDNRDADIIIAGLLHDSIEDQSTKVSGRPIENSESRRLAASILNKEYGKRVAGLVQLVSNSEQYHAASNLEDKFNFYTDHLREIVNEPDALLIKLSDFLSNCQYLLLDQGAKGNLYIANKYINAFPIFLENITNLPVNEKTIKSTEAELRAFYKIARRRVLETVK